MSESVQSLACPSFLPEMQIKEEGLMDGEPYNWHCCESPAGGLMVLVSVHRMYHHLHISWFTYYFSSRGAEMDFMMPFTLWSMELHLVVCGQPGLWALFTRSELFTAWMSSRQWGKQAEVQSGEDFVCSTTMKDGFTPPIVLKITIIMWNNLHIEECCFYSGKHHGDASVSPTGHDVRVM